MKMRFAFVAWLRYQGNGGNWMFSDYKKGMNLQRSFNLLFMKAKERIL
jgi:hypothetical protein